MTLRQVTLLSNFVYLFLGRLISLLSSLRGHVWVYKEATKVILAHLDCLKFDLDLEVKIKVQQLHTYSYSDQLVRS